MKKLAGIVTAIAISTASISGFASAATCDGTITLMGTGPNSNNVVSCNGLNNLTVTCNNNIWVGNVNNQDAVSGSGSATDNTGVGNVLSGKVHNDNGNTVEIGASCAPAAAGAGATVVETPGAGGAGETAAPTEAPTEAPAIPELPNTASSPAATIVAVSLAASAAVIAASRIAVVAYRRISIK